MVRGCKCRSTLEHLPCMCKNLGLYALHCKSQQTERPQKTTYLVHLYGEFDKQFFRRDEELQG